MTRQPRKSATGFTLTEILVVLAIVSSSALFIAFSFQNLLKHNKAYAVRQERTQDVAAALDRFSRDARHTRAVLELSPEQTTFWEEDPDSDHVASPSEVVSYHWRPNQINDPAPWVRQSSQGEEELVSLLDLRVGGDSLPPHTRHILIHASYGTLNDSYFLGTSVSLRQSADDHASEE